ncbi:hypothetical protein HDV00_009195 [Rhizophlyctis rosea]|nr:hypothetical protein HDV00_009195 [Rhizophlyctis rosea]
MKVVDRNKVVSHKLKQESHSASQFPHCLGPRAHHSHHFPDVPPTATTSLHETLISHHGFRRYQKWFVNIRLYTAVPPSSLIHDPEDAWLFEPSDPSANVSSKRGKALYFLSFGEEERRVWSFGVAGGGDAGEGSGEESEAVRGTMVEGGREIEGIVVRMKNLWTRRQDAVIEVCASIQLRMATGVTTIAHSRSAASASHPHIVASSYR